MDSSCALEARGLSVMLGGQQVLEIPSIQVRPSEVLVVIGPNGSGKTTLLRVLLGLEPADAGSVRLGANVVTGYYAQDAANLDRAATPLAVCGSGTLARTLLACLKLRPDRVHQPLGEASAGERAKVALVCLLVSGPNLLLLDEPTNHLEVEAQEALEQMLAQYPGTIIVVSHDRSFLDAIGPDEVLQL
jgi:ATP-binding cassette subfamily F protein 3